MAKEATTETVDVVGNAVTKKTFTVDVLKKHCKDLFGVPTVLFVGATSELDQSRKYSIDEIKSAIDAWSKKEVR